MSRECSLCCEVRRTTRSCGACAVDVCAACARRWLEDGRDPACPGCHRPWNTGEVRARTGNAFLSGPYRRARRRVLLNAQMPLLSRAVRLAQRERERRMRISAGASAGASGTSSSALRCGLCSCVTDPATGSCRACAVTTCSACGEVYEDGDVHVCHPHALASRAAILRECRPCVQCEAPTVRIEGCPTMWCPHCHAFWNWDTGRLIPSHRGAPHNPNHRAWARTRDVLDVPCGGLPDGGDLSGAFVREYVQRGEDLTLEVNAITVLAAWESVMVALVLRRSFQPRDTVQSLRVSRLLGDIDDDKFAALLERRERAADFRRDVDALLETFVHSVSCVLQRLAEPARAAPYHVDCAQCVDELNAVRSLTADALHAAGIAHARKPPKIYSAWTWETARVPRGLRRAP